MIKDIALSAYPADNVIELRKFYVEKLGIELGTAMDFDGKAAYTEGQVGSGWFALIRPDWLERPKGSVAGVMFEVDDLDATIADLRAKGVEVEDPQTFPTCRMSGLIDPEGNKVSLHQQTV